MTNSAARKRIDQASKPIKSSTQTVYRALIDPDALVSWLPPKGMKGLLHAFEPRVGGVYHMTFFYENEAHSTSGKTSLHSDVVRGRFVEISENERIVQQISFESADPAFAGVMTMTWRLTALPEGTEIMITCENVPDGITVEDHESGMKSTLENLAAFIEH